jgi:tRNA 2-thiouridine synthesizing protein A
MIPIQLGEKLFMEMIKTINACGLSCPQPVLLTRQALSSQPHGTVQVLVDSPTARDNVVRTAQKAGWKAEIQEQPNGNIQISLKK